MGQADCRCNTTLGSFSTRFDSHDAGCDHAETQHSVRAKWSLFASRCKPAAVARASLLATGGRRTTQPETIRATSNVALTPIRRQFFASHLAVHSSSAHSSPRRRSRLLGYARNGPFLRRATCICAHYIIDILKAGDSYHVTHRWRRA